jgi:hypothetical protein
VKFAHNTLICWSLERQKACTITIGTVPCKGVMRACSTSFSGFRALAARRGPPYSLASSGESGGYHHQNSHGHGARREHLQSSRIAPKSIVQRPSDTLTLARPSGQSSTGHVAMCYRSSAVYRTVYSLEKSAINGVFLRFSGGEGGIRTHGSPFCDVLIGNPALAEKNKIYGSTQQSPQARRFNAGREPLRARRSNTRLLVRS